MPSPLPTGAVESQGQGQSRTVQQDAAQHSPVVHNVRRSHYDRASSLNLIDVYAAILPSVPSPGVHVSFWDTVYRWGTGCRRWISKEPGGTEEAIAE
jgi:hypothetical protein